MARETRLEFGKAWIGAIAVDRMAAIAGPLLFRKGIAPIAVPG